MNVDFDRGVKFTAKCKELLATYSGDELQRICAEWTVDILNEVHFEAIPPKPNDVIEYEKIPYADRIYLGREYFQRFPGIMAYYELVRGIKVRNQANLEWLNYCKKFLSTADQQHINFKTEHITASMLPKRRIYPWENPYF